MRSVDDESVSAAPAWVSPQPLPARERRLLIWEIIVVFAVSLGLSAVRSLVLLIGSLTAPKALSAQHVVINRGQGVDRGGEAEADGRVQHDRPGVRGAVRERWHDVIVEGESER